MANKPDTRYEQTGDRAAKGMSLRSFRVTDVVWEAALAAAKENGEPLAEVLRRALIDYAGLPPETPGVVGRAPRKQIAGEETDEA